jgi:hypothetical protein
MAVAGHHARLGTQLLAKLCRGLHFRRLNSVSFQGTTRTDPYKHVYVYGSYEGACDVLASCMVKHRWRLRSVHLRNLDRSAAAWQECFDLKSAYYLTTGPVSLPHDSLPGASSRLPTSQRLEASWPGPFVHIPLPGHAWRAAPSHPDRHQPP